MHADFSCDRCGQLVRSDQTPGSIVRCNACGRKLAIPAHACGDARRIAIQCVEPPPQDVGVLHQFAPHDEPPMELAARAMPWVVSVFFHVGLMLIMAFLTLFVKADRKETLITPGEVGPVAESFPLKLEGRPSIPTTHVPTAPSARNYGPESPRPKTSGEMAKAGKPRLIGLGNPSGLPGPRSLGEMGEDSSMTIFTTQVPPGGTSARNMVFVIDKSGSMIDTFDIVRMELLRKIGYLTREHRFCVVFFSDGRLLETPPGGLMRATDDNKLAAAAFLADIRPAGQTDAAPALERAFNLLAQADPRLGRQIYLLTDGVFPDNRKVLDLIGRRNRKKEVMINTYLFGYRSPLAMEVLQKIAQDSGSVFRYVDPADVGAER